MYEFLDNIISIKFNKYSFCYQFASIITKLRVEVLRREQI